jgi:type I restriction enzyme S subunit
LKKTELVDSGIPVAGIENVLPNKFVKGFRRFITARKFEELSDYEILPDDVLVTTMGTIGRAAPAPPDVGRAIFDSHLFRMRVDTSRVFPPYLCFALNSDLVAYQFSRMARGAIMEGLNTTILRECSIPLPEMSDQRRIAGRLEDADRLVRTRLYALELTDTILPAAFLELFGDPVKNPRGFDHVVLGDDLDCIESGFSPVCEGPRESVNQWAVLGLGAVTTGIFKPAENKRLPDDVPPRPELEVHDGDVLVTRKNTYDLVAACALVRTPPQRLLLPDTIFRFRLNRSSRLSPVFLWGLFSFPSFRKRVQGLASGSAGSMPGISKNKFMSINCPVPSLPLQQKFATLVQRVERLRAAQREALRQAEHLFASLLHRAFSG